MTDPDSVGIMEGAFFVSKGELLSWMNEFFKVNIPKVETCASGAMYVQIFDAIFPGKVPMHKVNWEATNDYDFIKNYKILQSVFDKVGIQKHIEVDKLIKAKPLDNLEFLQWCKSYFDKKYGGNEYDAEHRRSLAPGGLLDWAKAPGARGMSGVPSNRVSKAGSQANSRKSSSVSKVRSESSAPKKTPPEAAAAAAAVAVAAAPVTVKDTTASDTQVQELKALLAEKDEQLRDREELLREQESTSDAVEKERDFYFRKLREIEILCQTNAKEEALAEFVAQVLEHLYSTDDEAATEANDGLDTEEEEPQDE
eukprot:GHVL01024795.1.p1 GENE.GHVL01024795.1~~GHVL01024795.1.p1  ORF type:complete len:311 (+),score=72.88 GHVL01024795.1:57-989(+)